MEISKMLTVSTGHVRESTLKLLAEDPLANRFPGIGVYEKDEYGFILYLTGENLLEKLDCLPADLAIAVKFTLDAGCNILCLDCDGEEVDALPLYNWDTDTIERPGKASASACDERGICPHCGNMVNYIDHEMIVGFYGNFRARFQWECYNCGATGFEGYDLVYDGTKEYTTMEENAENQKAPSDFQPENGAEKAPEPSEGNVDHSSSIVDGKEGICPHCGSDITYGSFELVDNGGYYDWECGNCGATGKEGYDLVFDGNHYNVSVPEKECPQKLMVATIQELAKYIVSRIDTENVLQKKFPNCDFGIIDVDGETEFDQEELEFLHSGVCGWYGLKQVKTGFDSDVLMGVVDYYGGSCASVFELYDSIHKEDAEMAVAIAIRERLSLQEVVTDDTTLLVEFLDAD